MAYRCWYLYKTAGGHSRKSINPFIPTKKKENTCSALSTMKAGTRMAHCTLDPTTLTSAPSHHFPGTHIKGRCSKSPKIRLRSERRWGFIPSSLPHSHEPQSLLPTPQVEQRTKGRSQEKRMWQERRVLQICGVHVPWRLQGKLSTTDSHLKTETRAL